VGAGQHLLASLLALATFLGAISHDFVFGELLALLRALLANVGASLADVDGIRAAPSHDARRRRAQIGAILATGQRFAVHSFAAAQHRRAVIGARIALSLAIGALFGAFLKSISVRGDFRVCPARFIGCVDANGSEGGPEDERGHTGKPTWTGHGETPSE